jgi:hypothetical protein
MSESEKRDVNYDARENKKAIESNLKNKDRRMKKAERKMWKR